MSKTKYFVFMADVVPASIGKLRSEITDAINNEYDELYILISSGGGNVFEGLSIAGFIKALSTKVITYNIGQIDSVANVIFAAGKERYAQRNSSFLFHGVTATIQNSVLTEQQLEEQFRVIKRCKEDISKNISSYTGIDISKTDSWMAMGTIINAEDALTQTIIHGIKDANIPLGSEVISIGNS